MALKTQTNIATNRRGFDWKVQKEQPGRPASSAGKTNHKEAWFQAAFNQTAVGIALTDIRTGRWLQVNQRYCDIVGYSPNEMRIMSFRDLTHPDDLPADLAQVARMRAGEITGFCMEKRMRHKDGRTVWVTLSVSATWGAEEPSDFYVAIIQDITTHKLAQEKAAKSEQTLRCILEHLPIAVVLVADDQKITYRNQRVESLLGYTARDIPDMESWWNTAHPEHATREQARQLWLQRRECARQSDGMIEPYEKKVLCRNGEIRYVKISGALTHVGCLLTLEDLSSHKAVQQRIEQLSYYDALTQLPNRHLLLEQAPKTLANSTANDRWGAVLLLDVDRFKLLNDTQGRDHGDALLLQIAQRLLGFTENRYLAARHGDDEFVVILDDLARQSEDAGSRAAERARQLLQILHAPYDLMGAPYQASICAGVVLFHGEQHGLDELLKRADLAVSQAKAFEHGSFRFYDPQIQLVVNDRARLEADIRMGLERHQFEIFYQPQMHKDSVVGAEALVRWRHPEKGCVSPAYFISVAEEAGSILQLGSEVLRGACQQLASWGHRPGLNKLTLSVNVSPRQFYQNDFVSQVLRILAQTGARAHRLKLEITERLLLRDVEGTIRKMAQLQAHGVRFSLDDFGTGYSSLAYLKRLPLDELKIDQSFVQGVPGNCNDAAIVRSVISLAQSLGLSVIAEGVETEEHKRFLEQHGCQRYQGYLFGRPVCADAFETLVKDVQPVGHSTEVHR
ncbi:putative bifunctional diguanylate cyclase/phosphodiesterase [Castellaniella caeni]|uniref:putative bifunctional diguanylate cyclase/phosphodiesterase n=1 Tax=Castellaniella caeni TaxID=266123 RepID=UPI000C9FB2E6|nr:GGDEF domain-containing phosphodiesterase [Castellaniella caeni]